MRFILHALWSLIFVAIMVFVASLICYVLMSLVGFLHFITACIVCGVVGAIAGISALGGPITISQNGYLPKGVEKTKTLPKKTPSALYGWSWIYFALAIACVAGFIFYRNGTLNVAESDDGQVAALFIGGAALYVVYFITTLVRISSASCKKCGCYDCKVVTKVTNSKEWDCVKTTTTYEDYIPTKKKVETYREKSWTTHYRCMWCGEKGKVDETSSVKTGEEVS